MYRPYGLTAEPEMSAWHEIGPDDEWLVLASDGIFEVLTEADICDIAAATSAGLISAGPPNCSGDRNLPLRVFM